MAQGVNSLVGGEMPMMTEAPAAAAPDREGGLRGFGGTVSSFLGSGRNVVTDGSEWVVALLVVLSLLFLISLRAGGITSIIVEG